ncbi:MAG: uroporphyrinogen decarboxylase family protein [Christensenellales bacterium]
MKKREPNFENMLKVLRREKPDRPVLFELFMNMKLFALVNGHKPTGDDDVSIARFTVEAFQKLGYDYATVHGSDFAFPHGETARIHTISLNDGAVIFDEKTFEAYPWPDPDGYDYSRLEKIRSFLPDGMKLMVMGPGGVLENAIALAGYDNLCYMLYDAPELAQRIFDAVGSRLVGYYRNVLQYDAIGLISSNDDWGFNTQPMIAPEQMRKYVIPWHKKIVETCHAAGCPVFLHSCGNLSTLMDDIVNVGFDAKHSFEDNILPIEEAYEAWHSRIALLGGIDVDFICRRPEADVRRRVAAMLERVSGRGGWAVGTGNSVPEYIPVGQYLAMVETAIGYNPFDA